MKPGSIIKSFLHSATCRLPPASCHLLPAACFLLHAACFLLYSCSHKNSGDSPKIFRYNEASGITSLDPAYASNLPNIWAVIQLYNTPVQFDDSLRLVPALAEKWEILDEGKTVRLYIRKGVKFHDDACFPGGKGREINAGDVVYSLRRLASEGPGGWIINKVRRTNDLPDIVVKENYIAEIRLENPFAQFISLLANPYCSVVPREAVEYYGRDFRAHPVGTGPFRLQRWWENEKLVLRKNEIYWEENLPYLDGISISFLKEKQTVFLELLRGKMDFISGIDPAYKNQALDQTGQLREKVAEKINLFKTPYLNTEYIGFYLEGTSPFTEKYVRQALSWYTDREKLVQFIRLGIGEAGTQGFIPPGMPFSGQYAVKGYSYDPARGNECLLKAGYSNPQEVPSFTLYMDVAYSDIATALVNQWKEAGFNVTAEILDRPTLKSQVAKGSLPVFRGSWIADYPDAENYFSLFCSANKSPNGPNYTHFENTEFDRLYDLSTRETSDSLRYNYYRQMDSLLMEECPVIVLFYDEVARFVRKDIEGLDPNPMNYLYLKRVQSTEY